MHLRAVFPLDLTDHRIGGSTKLLGIVRMKPGIEVTAERRFVVAGALITARAAIPRQSQPSPP